MRDLTSDHSRRAQWSALSPRQKESLGAMWAIMGLALISFQPCFPGHRRAGQAIPITSSYLLKHGTTTDSKNLSGRAAGFPAISTVTSNSVPLPPPESPELPRGRPRRQLSFPRVSPPHCGGSSLSQSDLIQAAADAGVALQAHDYTVDRADRVGNDNLSPEREAEQPHLLVE